MSRAKATSDRLIAAKGTPVVTRKRDGASIVVRSGHAVVLDSTNVNFGSEVPILDTDETLMVNADLEPQAGATIEYANKVRVIALKPRPVYDGGVVCFYYVVARMG